MKKLLLGLGIGLLSFSSYSSELKCSESYDLFQVISNGAREVRRRGDLKEIKAHMGIKVPNLADQFGVRCRSWNDLINELDITH